MKATPNSPFPDNFEGVIWQPIPFVFWTARTMSLYALSDLLVFGLWKHQICDLTFQGRSHLFVCTVVFVVSILSEAPVSAHDVWFGSEYIVLNPQPGGPGQLYEIRLTKWCDQVGRSMVVVSQLRWASTSSFSLSDYILELKRDWHDNRHQLDLVNYAQPECPQYLCQSSCFSTG